MWNRGRRQKGKASVESQHTLAVVRAVLIRLGHGMVAAAQGFDLVSQLQVAADLAAIQRTLEVLEAASESQGWADSLNMMQESRN